MNLKRTITCKKTKKMDLSVDKYEQALSIEKKSDLTFVHNFLGFGNCESACKVEIWFDIPTNIGNVCFILFTNIDKGTSVTNAAEILVTEIFGKCFAHNSYTKEQCVFAETYDRIQIDIIIPTWTGNECTNVTWKHAGKIIK